MNADALREFYEQTWQSLGRDVPQDRGLSNPLFIDVLEPYRKAKIRLMIVGKETFKWFGLFGSVSGPNAVEVIQKHYREFNVGENYRRTPFWLAVRKLEDLLGPDVPKLGIIWSNVFPCDQSRRAPDPDIASKLLNLRVLPNEIKLLKPDAVVFFTGHYYDISILRLFPKAIFQSCDDGDGRLLCRIKDSDASMNAFRTYHPNYFRRSKQWDLLIEQLTNIVEMIRNDPK